MNLEIKRDLVSNWFKTLQNAFCEDIVKIENTQVQGKSLNEAVDLMRGPVGSSIELTVRRRGEKKALIFKVTREIIEIKS